MNSQLVFLRPIYGGARVASLTQTHCIKRLLHDSFETLDLYALSVDFWRQSEPIEILLTLLPGPIRHEIDLESRITVATFCSLLQYLAQINFAIIISGACCKSMANVDFGIGLSCRMLWELGEWARRFWILPFGSH